MIFHVSPTNPGCVIGVRYIPSFKYKINIIMYAYRYNTLLGIWVQCISPVKGVVIPSVII